MKPKVSIIIPVYNAGKYLLQTLDSINEEINFEIIVVDDGSSDLETKQIVDRLAQEKKYKIVRQKNAGSGEARNTGAKAAAGDYLLFLDSDDLIEKNFCTKMARVLDENPNISFCYPNELLFGSRTGFWNVPQYDPKLLLYYQYFMVTSLIRKSDFDRLGGFDPKFKYLEDREFWVRSAAKGLIGQKAPVLHFYRHHALSKTSAVNKSKIMNCWEKKIRRKHKAHYHLSDFFNKKVLFYSLYIRFFYFIPTSVKNFVLKRGLRELKKQGYDLQDFPAEVRNYYEKTRF